MATGIDIGGNKNQMLAGIFRFDVERQIGKMKKHEKKQFEILGWNNKSIDNCRPLASINCSG